MAALQAESNRLVGPGARQVARVEPDQALEAGLIRMENPGDNKFCLD